MSESPLTPTSTREVMKVGLHVFGGLGVENLGNHLQSDHQMIQEKKNWWECETDMLSSRVLQASYHLSQHRTPILWFLSNDHHLNGRRKEKVIPTKLIYLESTQQSPRYSQQKLKNPKECELPLKEGFDQEHPSRCCTFGSFMSHPNLSTTAIAVQFPNRKVLKLINRRINFLNRESSLNCQSNNLFKSNYDDSAGANISSKDICSL